MRNLGCVTFTVQQTIDRAVRAVGIIYRLTFSILAYDLLFTSFLETCERFNKEYAWFNIYFKPTLG